MQWWRSGVLLAVCVVSTAAQPPTFSRDVWPILEQHCISCHQQGEIAPMVFTSYELTRPWARAIRQAALLRKMPPWDATPSAEHPFRNQRTLTQKEIDTLAAWADSGAAEGDKLPEYVPVPRVNGKWKLGQPDMVVRVPGFHVPKSGQVPYSFLIVPTHFTHDVCVRAAEYRIDHRALIHHINTFVRPPGSSFLTGFPAGQVFVPTLAQRASKRSGENVFDRRELLQGYEPGYEPAPWLPDGAKLIRAGSDLVLELHYTPKGSEAVDYSEVGLYFSKDMPARRVLAIDTLRDLDLRIPPGDGNYRSEASMTLGRSVQLLSVQPHMHLRGKSMEVRAEFPNGNNAVLVQVPKYDFNWQTTYVFEKPVELPEGTKLTSVAYFDNSAGNPSNPDPGALVRWGDQTTEEMHIAFLELATEAGADPSQILKEQPKMLKAELSGP
jgi:hypothetical protein